MDGSDGCWKLLAAYRSDMVVGIKHVTYSVGGFGEQVSPGIYVGLKTKKITLVFLAHDIANCFPFTSCRLAISWERGRKQSHMSFFFC